MTDTTPIIWQRSFLVRLHQTVTCDAPTDLVKAVLVSEPEADADAAADLDHWVCANTLEAQWTEITEPVDGDIDEMEYGFAPGQPDPEDEATVLSRLLVEAYGAAEEDSNDNEIDALHLALGQAVEMLKARGVKVLRPDND